MSHHWSKCNHNIWNFIASVITFDCLCDCNWLLVWLHLIPSVIIYDCLCDYNWFFLWLHLIVCVIIIDSFCDYICLLVWLHVICVYIDASPCRVCVQIILFWNAWLHFMWAHTTLCTKLNCVCFRLFWIKTKTIHTEKNIMYSWFNQNQNIHTGQL